MLDHLSLGVSDLLRAVAFYDAALAPLGYVRLWGHERGPGYYAAFVRDPDGHRREAVLHETAGLGMQ